jgi:hypothetical protein
MPLILKDARHDERVVMQSPANLLTIQELLECWKGGQKNAGLAMVTLNLHSQPRLPGSVVGERSMR